MDDGDSAPAPEDSSVERGRDKLGKADLYGSCRAITDEGQYLVEKFYCGGKSYGNCWCDDENARFRNGHVVDIDNRPVTVCPEIATHRGCAPR